MAEPLERWAAERAPELVARAEAAAVATLRDALVRAASAAPVAPTTQEPAPAPEPARIPDGGELLWAYGVIRDAGTAAQDLAGVEPGAPVETVAAAGLVALVSRVPAADYAEEPLRGNLNELPWLERVARAHEAVLEATLRRETVVPVRLCTIYADRASVRRMLERERDELAGALDALDGREEWGLKVLVDADTLVRRA